MADHLAQVLQGVKGGKGDQGDKGEKGDKGDKGYEGPPGATMTQMRATLREEMGMMGEKLREEMAASMAIFEERAIARSYNKGLSFNQPLQKLPLDDGTVPDDFPDTPTEMEQMDAAAVLAWVETYRLRQVTESERKQQLFRFVGR